MNSARVTPTYFENQRQAAAVLGLDEFDLKEWKAVGCPAFKYGRIYHAALLEWMETHPPRRHTTLARPSQQPLTPEKERMRLFVCVMIALAEAFDAGLLTRDLYFEQSKALVDAAGDADIRQQWIENTLNSMRVAFPKIDDAWTAHPQIMRWLNSEAGRRKAGSPIT